MYLLSEKIAFPPVRLADKDGLLAIGGDLSVERLVLAYKSGIFPWYNEGEPIIMKGNQLFGTVQILEWYCFQKI